MRIVCRVSCHHWQSSFCFRCLEVLYTKWWLPCDRKFCFRQSHCIRDSLSVSFQVNICQKHLSMSLKQLRPIHYSEGSIEWHSPERAMWSCQMKWIDVPGTWPVCLLLGSDRVKALVAPEKRRCKFWEVVLCKMERKVNSNIDPGWKKVIY